MDEIKNFCKEYKSEIILTLSIIGYTRYVSKIAYKAGLRAGIMHGYLYALNKGGK